MCCLCCSLVPPPAPYVTKPRPHKAWSLLRRSTRGGGRPSHIAAGRTLNSSVEVELKIVAIFLHCTKKRHRDASADRRCHASLLCGLCSAEHQRHHPPFIQRGGDGRRVGLRRGAARRTRGDLRGRRRGRPGGLVGKLGSVPAPAPGAAGAAPRPAEGALRPGAGRPEQPGLDGRGAGRGPGDGQRHAAAAGDRGAAALRHQGAARRGPDRPLRDRRARES